MPADGDALNDTERALLRAEVRALVSENATALRLVPTAALDLTNRLLAAGALLVGGRVSMPDGSNPISYVENVYRHDPDSAHLFSPPTNGGPSPPEPPPPKPNP